MSEQELSVRLYGHEVGVLARTRRGARFAYAEEVVDGHLGQPVLSLSLPVKRRPYSEGLTGSWFRGLLPEGERLTGICRAIGCAESDYVSVLSRIGWECAGAVSVAPFGFEPPQAHAPQKLTPSQLAAKLRELPAYGGVDPTAHVSLGGFQEKLLVVGTDVHVESGYIERAQWAQPDVSTISTHIIKPQPALRYPHIIEAEAWAMVTAQQAARCSQVALLQIDDAPLSLVVERFDRIRANGVLERVHQEDCCQALGMPPESKYAGIDRQRGTDPTYVGIARLLDAYSSNPAEEQRELLRQLVTNLVLGNTDAHAKNYSLIYWEPSVPTMAPLYDVVPVVDVEPRARHLSMRVGGIVKLESVMRTHVIEEAASWGMLPDEAVHIIDQTLERLVGGIDLATSLYPEAGRRHREGALHRARQLSC